MFLNRTHPEYSLAHELLCCLAPAGSAYRADMESLVHDLDLKRNSDLTGPINELMRLGLSVLTGNHGHKRSVWIGDPTWAKAKRLGQQYWDKVNQEPQR